MRLKEKRNQLTKGNIMQKSDKKPMHNKMGEMPVGRLILNMSWPAILSMFIQAFYNVVDSFFVSRLGEEALAALTYVNPIQFLIISFGVGTGVGINSLISRRLGAGKIEEANLAACHGYRLSFFNWGLFLIIGLFFAKPLMHMMSENPQIIDYGSTYMQIISIGSLFILIQVSTEKILQSTGNMKLPMFCSLVGAITNIILDPLLIFGIGPFPEMGVAGAAVATVFGQFLSMCLGQYLLFAKEHSVKVRLRGWKMDKQIIKDIYAVGAPSILMQSIMSIMQFGMNMILGGLTETAVAVNGVYGRLQSFIFMPVFGLNQGVMPVLGYNYGARNRKRLMEAYIKSFLIAFCIMSVGFAIFQLFPEQLLSIFNAQGSESMYEIGIPALKIISLCFMPAAYGIMTTSVFQATGHGFISLWSSMIRQLVGILPLAWIFSKIAGLPLVWYSFPLAELLGVTFLTIMLVRIYKKEIKRLDEIS